MSSILNKTTQIYFFVWKTALIINHGFLDFYHQKTKLFFTKKIQTKKVAHVWAAFAAPIHHFNPVVLTSLRRAQTTKQWWVGSVRTPGHMHERTYSEHETWSQWTRSPSPVIDWAIIGDYTFYIYNAVLRKKTLWWVPKINELMIKCKNVKM
jgi:hypothetical protein